MNISYNSNALHKASSPAFQPEAIYKALQHGMPDEEPILAKRSINGNNYQWTIPNAPGETWQKLGDASVFEQEAVRDAIRAYKARASKILHIGAEETDAIFSTPNDNDCIYFCNSSGKLRVCIVGWDFVNSSTGSTHKVITEDLKKQKQDVIIRFIKDGQPASGTPFVLSLPTGFSKLYTMPANGMLPLGKILVGLRILLDINNSQKTDSFTVEKDRNIYEFDLTEPKTEPEPPVEEPQPEPDPEPEPPTEPEPEEPEEVPVPAEKPDEIPVPPPFEDPGPPSPPPLRRISPKLRVIDANGDIVASFPVDIIYPDNHAEHIFTDSNGEYQLIEMAEGETFSARDSFSNNTATFTVDPDQAVYEFRLDYVSSSQNPDIKVKVIDEKEKPVYPARIALTQEGRTLLIQQKEDGIFYLSNGYFKNDVPIEIKLVDDKKNEYSATDFKLSEKEKEYTIQLDTKDCPWWKKLVERLIVASAVAIGVFCFRPIYNLLAEIVRATY